MIFRDNKIIKLKELNTLRTAPSLTKAQAKSLFIEVNNIIDKADWLTIGIMSPSINKAIDAIRNIENKFKLKAMQCITRPDDDGPIFLKANQRTGEIHARIEYGLGEGILISCHKNDNDKLAKTIGPFPLDFFK